MTQLWEVKQNRRLPRIALEVEVIVIANGAMLPGRTQDICESGWRRFFLSNYMCALKSNFKLPAGTQTVRAVVRHKNIYRHGFEFAQPLAALNLD